MNLCALSLIPTGLLVEGVVAYLPSGRFGLQLGPASQRTGRKRSFLLYESQNLGNEDAAGRGDKSSLEEQRRRIFEKASPRLPETGRPPSKAEIYGEDELQGLLDLHKQLSSQTRLGEEEKDTTSEIDIPSIHDLVLETLGEEGETRHPSYAWLTEDIKERATSIKAIASDVDGTLIGSDQSFHPRTKEAIKKAVQASFSPMEGLKYFFPATGKTRAGAFNSLGPEISVLLHQCPGVFIQGLYCIYGDKVIFEKKLEKQAVAACEKLVAQTGTSIIAYDGDSLYTTDFTQTVINLHEIYGEPMSEEIPSITDHEPGVHKILVCDEDTEKLSQVVRPKLEGVALACNARVTQAVPTMLELIPEGCSKALGVEKLCEVLGIDPSTELLALGDAENDAEMLQMASIGVVMGNGTPPAREAGDIVLEETSDEGGAGLAIEAIVGLN
mmetsp:Transcript_30299/g.87372  ORF Transcript_30299/g.87372 Transcript_30299/m.87372 type:complete len:442 (-) Transcript_30299:67-1392(-)|eukprot:CAMPEP_0176052736 /NCGR_PEP_ID=MMETSP0120_2-20121206/26223_1 /TAXON_ID=160619 /ORGANISM="Kryptoperidinium foliaceum, Strain CCMP 1326" /LENGTH=441 /DNA_ID=CAMNT_0017386179 /DNA_START=148 /DNA_END=1473 /DNA_ORIENTATION=-